MRRRPARRRLRPAPTSPGLATRVESRTSRHKGANAPGRPPAKVRLGRHAPAASAGARQRLSFAYELIALRVKVRGDQRRWHLINVEATNLWTERRQRGHTETSVCSDTLVRNSRTFKRIAPSSGTPREKRGHSCSGHAGVIAYANHGGETPRGPDNICSDARGMADAAVYVESWLTLARAPCAIVGSVGIRNLEFEDGPTSVGD